MCDAFFFVDGLWHLWMEYIKIGWTEITKVIIELARWESIDYKNSLIHIRQLNKKKKRKKSKNQKSHKKQFSFLKCWPFVMGLFFHSFSFFIFVTMKKHMGKKICVSIVLLFFIRWVQLRGYCFLLFFLFFLLASSFDDAFMCERWMRHIKRFLPSFSFNSFFGNS